VTKKLFTQGNEKGDFKMRCFCSHLNRCFFGFGILFIGSCISWADDIEIDLNSGSTPTTNGVPSEKDLSTSKNLKKEIDGTPIASAGGSGLVEATPSAGQKNITSNIRSLNFSPEGQGAKVSIEGNDLPKPTVQKISNKKVLLKFPKTKLSIPAQMAGSVSMIKDVRSSIHAGTAWLVLDGNNIKKLILEKSDVGFSLSLNPEENENNLNVSESTTPVLVGGGVDEKEKGLFSRLVDISLKPYSNGIKVVLTSDGPSKYTIRKLSRPEKMVIRFQNTKLQIEDKLKNIKADELEIQKSGLLSLNCRQIGPVFSPISEVMLTLVPGTISQIDRDLNQVVLSLSAPTVIQKQEAKKGNLNQIVSLDLESADINAVVKTLAGEAGFEVNFVGGPLAGVVSEKFKDIPLKTALSDLLAPGNYGYDLQGNTLRVGSQDTLKNTKLILPHVTEIINPSGGNTPAQFDTLVRSILPVSNASNSIIDTARNVIVLNGTASDIEEYKMAIKDLKLDVGSSGDRIIRVVKLNYADATQLSLILTPYLTPVGKVQVKKDLQQLVLWETATNMGVLLELINELDIKPPQVVIESNIIEISDENDSAMGVVWNAQRITGNPTVSASADLPPQTTNALPGVLTFGTVTSGMNISASIEALVTHKKGKVISRPRVSTESGVLAEINETENVIIPTTTQTLVPNVGIQFTTVYTQVALPIDLKVTPRITDDGKITTVISASITTPSGTAAPNAPPPTNVQTATTTITTKNGETIVIGGLVRDVVEDETDGLPLLSSLPIIGSLFQVHSKSDQKEELVIFVTPTLLED
jgi:type II secretory pathway component GspD/PulD (secretin)